MRISALILLGFILASCVQSKAAIDYAMSEGIVWPGEPEMPRVKYLWSLQRVSGGEGASKLIRLLAGEETAAVGDPRSSDSLIKPQGIFLDGKEKLYIADPGAYRVSVVNLKDMKSFNIESAAETPLAAPIGVVTSPDGRIYVTDADLKAVLAFNEKGKFLFSFEGTFGRPTGIAINPEKGMIYVADTWGHKIYIYNLDGKRTGSIGSRGEEPGALNYPTYIAVDGNGDIYVSDTLNFRVQIFTGEGTLVGSFGLVGDSYENFDKIKGIAVDSGGHIYIADSALDMIKIFDREGRLLLFFGAKGNFYGNFFLPTGMYIDGSDRIFISDSLNMRVQAFQFLGDD